jgi:hypothetical protein
LPRREIEGAYVIESNNMVIMFMGQENALEMADFGLQHLLSEIGPTIDDQIQIALADEGRRTESFIFLIGGMTHFAGTP